MDNVEIPNWLNKLPLAPTFYPTDTEFLDPIAYISKIEKEASVFGICKVIPPLPKPSKKYVFSNLNKSLLNFPESDSSSSSGDKHNNNNNDNNGENRPVFTTRHQELGCTTKRTKGQVSLHQSGVHKQVWQSGEVYTLEQFQSKAKSFARNQLGMIKEVTPLVVEALFWKTASERPIYIEYANDVPGSGFGEPEEPCQYFHRRRRKKRRQFNRNHQENPNNDASRNSYIIDREKDVLMKNDSGSPRETSTQLLNSPPLMSEQTSRIRRQSSLNLGKEMEGTAGWKLSNSPWNLQVIARSPGSLTRFMLDDIPGVTSPMVYIGMLFSWFAWHVEDHELHSLNFLHTGSSKSWYAVPGDYAFRFEEVIRSKGYGGNLDRLAALTLLGEKTNLLSPEVVVASGIPCCRLIQNPGEFVVTFPRAYHIGFSQGFNCGEAANFGTPQWLKVAKAAAIRRAAMNYLPMLSHQQLLYMLTMSFVSSVPKALLSGARTSRSKDRQKEERELLVKKAFIDDMLNEKNLLLVLHGKDSTFYAVLWDPETLPSPESVSDETSTISAMSIGRTSVGYQNNDSCNNQVDSTRMYRETLEDSNVGDDDLPCGLHVDSGTLACVACGVLGFPFMSIVQPSWRASEELFPADCQVTQVPEVLRSMKPNAPPGPCDAVMESASDAHCCYKNQKASSSCRRDKENCLWRFYTDAVSTPSEVTETIELKESTSLPYPSNVELNCSMIHSVDGHPLASKGRSLHSSSNSHKKWNTSNGFLRPRVFCLEHALEIERLLHSKGGANVLIICHSAYPKIKAHAFAVAEEINVPFDCDEIPLRCASKEDTDLITISIDDTEHEEGGEDWTSRLGLNLRYCVKLRKLYPSKQEEQHALALGGLFSDMFPDLDHLNLKWKSRRSRTPYQTAGSSQSKSCGSIQIKKNDVHVGKTKGINAAGENKVMQYSRRSCNRKTVSPLQTCNGHCSCSKKHQHEYALTNNRVLDNNIPKDTLCSIQKNGNDFVELNKSTIVNSGMQHKNCTSEETRGINEIFYPPKFSGLFSTENTENDVSKLAKSAAVENSEVQRNSCSIVEETKGTSEVSDPVKCMGVLVVENIEDESHELDGLLSAENHNLSVTEETREAREVSDDVRSVGSLTIPNPGVRTFDAPLIDRSVDKTNKGVTDYKFVTVDSSKMQNMAILDENSEISNISDPIKSPSSEPIVTSYAQIGTRSLMEDKAEDEFCSNVTLDIFRMQVESRTIDANCEVRVGDFASSVAHPSLSSSMVGSSEEREFQDLDEANKGGEICSSAQDTMVLEDIHSTMFDLPSTKRERSKRRRELDQITEDVGFIKSPCEGLRPRATRISICGIGSDVKTRVEAARKKAKRSPSGSVICKEQKVKDGELHRCDIEGCRMSFETKDQLIMHKCNRCTHKGCRKQFSSHKYAMLHQRVHIDERPLKCPWKDCTMSFKWAWARTEHLRLHTGERPYQCKIEGCGLTFRFVSDFSRHKRNSGHYVDSSSS